MDITPCTTHEVRVAHSMVPHSCPSWWFGAKRANFPKVVVGLERGEVKELLRCGYMG